MPAACSALSSRLARGMDVNGLDQRFADTFDAPRGTRNVPATVATSPIALVPAASLPAHGRGFIWQDVVITALLRRRTLLLVFLVPLLASAAVALVSGVRHTAESLLIVSVSRESAGNSDIGGYGPSILSVDTPKAVQSEIEIITSDGVAQAALRRIGVANLYPSVAGRRWFGLLPALPAEEQLERASELLRRDLRADVTANTNIVRVQFTYRERSEAVSALRTLLDAYMARRREIFTDPSAQFLSTEVTRYTDRLRAVEAEIGRIKQSYGILDVEQNVRLAAGRLDTIVQREDRIREQRESALAQLESANTRLRTQPGRVFASSEVTNQPGNDDSRNALLRLQIDREHLAAQYAPGYPALVEMDRKIAAARDSVRQSARTNFFTNREVRNPSVELLSTRVTQMQVEADALGRSLTEVTRQRKEAEASNAALLGAEAQLRDLGRQRDALEAVYRQFATREAGARLNDEARQTRDAAVHLVQQPTAPVAGRSMTLSYVLAGFLAGGLFAAAAALLLTALRRTYATPGEAERSLYLSTLASFPLSGSPFALGRDSPAVADLAALLLDMGAGGRMQLIQFVATDDEDQRDRLARAVSVELARIHGRRVLLIDLGSDGRAHLAGLGVQSPPAEDPQGGLMAVSTGIPKLWVTFNAPDSILADPHALRQDVEQLIGQLRDEFDAVMMVGPAVIDSYAQRRLTVLVDANIVVVRAERTEAPQARQLRESILSSGGNLLGLVFTGQRQVVPRAIQQAMQ